MRLYKYRSLSSSAREHTLDVIRKCELCEWRILEHERGAGAYSFNSIDLEEVVFGMNTPKDSVREIRDALSGAGISAELKRAVPHKSEFKLELVDEAA